MSRNILKLKGFKLDNYKSRDNLNQVFMGKIMDSTKTQTLLLPRNYEDLPLIFTGIESWPKSTNLHCWYCDCQFNTIPLFIPESISVDGCGSIRSMDRHGVFHSFNCIMFYIMQKYKRKEKRDEIYRLVRLLFRAIYGRDAQEEFGAIIEKTKMRKYGGGTLTEEEYKDAIAAAEKGY